MARLSITDKFGRPLYDLPQRTGSHGSAVDLSVRRHASFWVGYTDCADFGAGRLSYVAERQVVALPGIAGTMSAPSYSPRTWPVKCPLVVSAAVGGVFRMAPGFTSGSSLKSVR